MRVLDILTALFCEKYGCDPDDVAMAASLDELNIAPHERDDMAMVLGEIYGVDIDDDTLDGFETVEDVVAYIEDTLNEED
ncbi:MAG: acyl carrier protein [Clostridia bacterium]|nr:acyl carrier protein [Clostridia bacterium]